MQAVQDIQAVTECNGHLSGYELTTLLIRNGKRLGLKSSELLVFTALASYWNGKPVYPKIKTLEDNTALSDKAVRTALNGLIDKGYILKSKRGKNANVYNINVSAVLSNVENGKNNRLSAVISTAPMIMKLNHEKLEQQRAVVSIKEFKGAEERTIKEKSCTAVSVLSETNLNEIPLCLRRKASKGIIRNLGGYWRSLRPAVKMEYIEQDKKEREEAERKEEARKQREAERELERKEELKRQEELTKPITEQMTREEAVKQIQTLYRTFGKKALTGVRTKEIIRAFEISETEYAKADGVSCMVE